MGIFSELTWKGKRKRARESLSDTDTAEDSGCSGETDMGLVWMGGGAGRETPATLLNSKHNGLQHVKWPQLNSTSTRSSRQARTRALQQLTRTAASLVHHFAILNKSHPITSLKTVIYSAAFAALLLPAFCHSFSISHSPPPIVKSRKPKSPGDIWEGGGNAKLP